MRVTIFSGGEILGQVVANTALAHGDSVTIYMPDTSRIWPRKNLTIMQGSLMAREHVMEALLDADAVVSTLMVSAREFPGRRAFPVTESNMMILNCMHHLGKKRFITIGHIHPPLPDSMPEPLQNRIQQAAAPVLYAENRRMAEILRQTDLDWTMVRIRSFDLRTAEVNYDISLDAKNCKRGVNIYEVSDFMYQLASDPNAYSHEMPVIYEKIEKKSLPKLNLNSGRVVISKLTAKIRHTESSEILEAEFTEIAEEYVTPGKHFRFRIRGLKGDKEAKETAGTEKAEETYFEDSDQESPKSEV